MKKIFITGAGGFIGSHLTQKLVKKGYTVTALFRYNSSNSKGWLDIDKDESDGNFESLFCDLGDKDFLNRALKKQDIVLHLGALIGIPYSYKAVESYIKSNIIGTHNILEGCIKNNVSHLIHTSTSEVYGTPKDLPINEKNLLQPQSPYAASKVAADQLAMSYNKSFNLPVTIIRPFNNFGPRQSNRAVIPTIINQILNKKNNILKIGSINTKRDFLYVEDTVQAYLKIMNKKNSYGQTYNIGTGLEISIKDLIFKIIKLTNRKNIIIKNQKIRNRPEKSEVMRLLCDYSKIKKEIKWSPKIKSKKDFDKFLIKTIEWYNQNNFKFINKENFYV
ncbi:GDP-mannose 4,6-dehydratase [Candidatus Pelagibacter sp.]|nr:GDP-mannose 4,6-dehydratase [Candidatus Pelagibacter sp.]